MNQDKKIANRRDKVLSLRVINPWVTNSEIAKELGVSESVISRDFNELENQDKIVSVQMPAKGKYLGQFDTFYVFIETSWMGSKPPKNGYQQEIVRQIEQKLIEPELADVIVFGGIDILLGGPYDILLKIYSGKPKPIHEFVINHLRSIPHIIRSSTAWKPR